MFEVDLPEGLPKPRLYEHLLGQLDALFEGERDVLANASNLTSLLYHTLPAVNWVGFYLRKGKSLVLGPFQGKPACVRIPVGKGVCGTCAARREPVLVDDVQSFPGHIACDSDSRAEIVLPLLVERRLLGVLDVDSPVEGRFDEDDRAGLATVLERFLAASDVDPSVLDRRGP